MNKVRERRIKSIGITVILLLAFIASMSFVQAAPGDVEIKWADPDGNPGDPIDVTIGDSFQYNLYFNIENISQAWQAQDAENYVEFKPAGIINYTSAAQGTLTINASVWVVPKFSEGDVSNSSGWFKDLAGSFTDGNDVNNTAGSVANITWYANAVGTATIYHNGSRTSYAGSAGDMNFIRTEGIVRVHPQDPSSFSVADEGPDWFNMSWATADGIDNYVIVRSKTATPTDPTEGTEIYNDTGLYHNDTSLDIEDDYYYSIWGYNTTEGYYSLAYESLTKETDNALPTTFTATTADKTTIDLAWTTTTNGKEILRPNAAGSSAEWDILGGSATNWESVDEETSDGDTTYIGATGSGDWDSYNIGDIAAEYPISAITVYGQIKADNSETCKLTIYDGTTTYESNDITPGSNYGLESNTWTTNPATSLEWKESEINDLEIGIKYTGSQVDRVYCTQLYLEVEYDLPTFVIERKESPETSWSQGDGDEIYNGTGVSFSDTGLWPDTHYYYQLWTYDDTTGNDLYSANHITAHDTTTDNINVSFSSVDPSDTATGIDKNYGEVSIDIADGDGDSFDYTIEGAYLTDTSENGVTDGTYTATLDAELPYDTVITWYVNATDGHDWTREVYTFTVRSEYEPTAPTGFTATQTDRFTMDLSWTAEDDYTYIEYSETPGSWARGDGTFLVNTTAESYTHIGLVEGTTYYYQAWSYNDTDWVYSAANSSDFETTVDDQQPLFSGEDPVNTTLDVDKTNSSVSIYIEDPEGDDMVWNITVTGDNGFYATDEGVATANGTISCALTTPLTYDETLTWTVTVTDRNETGTLMETNVEEYWFTVRSEYEPNAPASFTATTLNRTQIDLSWTTATHGEYVVIERNTTENWAMGDGTEIYNGTGTTYSDDGSVGLGGRLDDGVQYFYQAWSYNVTDVVYSPSYSEANDTTISNKIPNSPTSVTINEVAYTSVYDSYLNVTISDDDADTLNIVFYWGNNSAIYFENDVASGDYVNISLPEYINPEWLDHDTNYTWYVTIDDGFDIYNTSSEENLYWFITSKAYDINEDGEVNADDISVLVNAYGDECEPGEIGADIVENGQVDVDDVSALVNNYGWKL